MDQVKDTTDSPGQTLDIVNCCACRGPHKGLPVKRFKTNMDPFTHWYICPRTGDPCNLTIKHFHGADVDLNPDVVNDLATAVHQGCFLVAIFTIEEGRTIVKRHAMSFPHSSFPAVAEVLHRNLMEEIGPPQPVQEMAAAAPMAPLNDPFSD